MSDNTSATERQLGSELYSELMGAVRLHTHDHGLSLQIVKELAPIIQRVVGAIEEDAFERGKVAGASPHDGSWP